jgi:hypothetical protein
MTYNDDSNISKENGNEVMDPSNSGGSTTTKLLFIFLNVESATRLLSRDMHG